jgi:GMP synthase (glutamine-hydrolysing)
VSQMITEKKCILGVCFGHELVLDVLGGQVGPRVGGRYMGVREVKLTCDGLADGLFFEMPSKLMVATGHSEEVLELPDRKDIRILGTSDSCRFEALAIGDRIRTVQFHPEISGEILRGIVEAFPSMLDEDGCIPSSEGDFADSFQVQRVMNVGEHGRQVIGNFVREFVERVE